MSYILDALKKSEQDRGHGNVPGVQTIHSSSLNYRSEKNTYWPYILIIAVILNLAAILYFIIDKDKPSADHIAVTEIKTVENDADEFTTTNNTQTTVSEDIKKQPAVTTSIAGSETMQQEINNKAATAPASTNEQMVTTASTDNDTRVNPSQTRTIADTNTVEDHTNIIEFYDLPDSIKQQLPAIIISAHVYSTNPLQRSIVINNNFMEEGEYVLDDLILHEITADGAIFNYKNTRFHYGVVSSWQ